ncbi:unnamed protein product, partial [Polarella glacialis]
MLFSKALSSSRPEPSSAVFLFPARAIWTKVFSATGWPEPALKADKVCHRQTSVLLLLRKLVVLDELELPHRGRDTWRTCGETGTAVGEAPTLLGGQQLLEQLGLGPRKRLGLISLLVVLLLVLLGLKRLSGSRQLPRPCPQHLLELSYASVLVADLVLRSGGASQRLAMHFHVVMPISSPTVHGKLRK